MNSKINGSHLFLQKKILFFWPRRGLEATAGSKLRRDGASKVVRWNRCEAGRHLLTLEGGEVGKSVGIFDFYDWILGLGGMVRALWKM